MGAPGHLVVDSVVELEAALTSDDRPAAQLVHYFGTRCPGCKTMHPKLLQLQKTYQGISFVMVRACCVCHRCSLMGTCNAASALASLPLPRLQPPPRTFPALVTMITIQS
jgi:protein-disulfide isomerase